MEIGKLSEFEQKALAGMKKELMMSIVKGLEFTTGKK